MKSRISTNDNFCLLLRGVPGSGKSTVAKSYMENYNHNLHLLDPDLINRDGKEYKHFRPRRNKNAKENVKMYSYLFWKAEHALRRGNSVIWTQPWSRLAEIELTIKNFAFYFTDYKKRVWNTDAYNLIQKLPFRFLIAKIVVPNELSVQRTKEKYQENFDLKRLVKTQKLFQDIKKEIPNITLSGEKPISESSKILNDFIIAHTNK